MNKTRLGNGRGVIPNKFRRLFWKHHLFSWKLAQDTPIDLPSANTEEPENPAATTAAAKINLFIIFLPKKFF